MIRLALAITPQELEQFCGWPGAYALAPSAPAMQEADAHWLAWRGDQIVGRCSLWHSTVPPYPQGEFAGLVPPGPGRLGLIGHYAVQDSAVGLALLEHGCAHLAAHGCTLAVGPLDGNTFRHYRLLTARSVDGLTRPPFALEPDNPDDWPEQWLQAGFTPFAEYVSALAELTPADPRTAELAARVAAAGVTIRPLDLGDLAAELRRVYAVVQASFAGNLLYSPMSEVEFAAQYGAVRSLIQPELLLLAEQAGRPVGFLFALPDWAQARRGQPVDTVIIKTVGVIPALGGIGLGGLLVALCQQTAYGLGYRQAIHALMLADNRSRRISARYARVMRRYTLYARRLV